TETKCGPVSPESPPGIRTYPTMKRSQIFAQIAPKYSESHSPQRDHDSIYHKPSIHELC
ncbi:hypothetical protein AVEN_180124-1, partial [Araneus ventricosus]